MNHHISTHVSFKDAENIARILRMEDTREILAATGKSPVLVLSSCLNSSSRLWTANGRYVALYGVNRPLASPVAVPWMVATDEIEKHGTFFLRHCRKQVDEWLQAFHHLTNCVDARNELHIRWLKWAGFQFIELIPEWGYAKLPFWRFEKVNHV